MISGKCLTPPPSRGTPFTLCSSVPPSPPCFLSVFLLFIIPPRSSSSPWSSSSPSAPFCSPQLPHPHTLSSQLLLLCSSATLRKMDYRWRGRRERAEVAECGFCVEMLFHNKSTETSSPPLLSPSRKTQSSRPITASVFGATQQQPASSPSTC